MDEVVVVSEDDLRLWLSRLDLLQGYGDVSHPGQGRVLRSARNYGTHIWRVTGTELTNLIKINLTVQQILRDLT